MIPQTAKFNILTPTLLEQRAAIPVAAKMKEGAASFTNVSYMSSTPSRMARIVKIMIPMVMLHPQQHVRGLPSEKNTILLLLITFNDSDGEY